MSIDLIIGNYELFRLFGRNRIVVKPNIESIGIKLKYEWFDLNWNNVYIWYKGYQRGYNNGQVMQDFELNRNEGIKPNIESIPRELRIRCSNLDCKYM